jgi:hypothetical protein
MAQAGLNVGNLELYARKILENPGNLHTPNHQMFKRLFFCYRIFALNVHFIACNNFPIITAYVCLF